MKKLLTVLGLACLAACGSDENASALLNSSADATENSVTVAEVRGNYSAKVTGAHAEKIKSSLSQTPYATPNGGLRIDCASNEKRCDVILAATSKDLSYVRRPYENGNTTLFQAWLSGDYGKDFYMQRLLVNERVITNASGQKTHIKELINAHDKSATLTVSCFKRTVPRLVIFWKTQYDCIFRLNGY